jgi:hypothetical protein
MEVILREQLRNSSEINKAFFVTAELKMDVLREREVKDNLERQLLDEQKMRGELFDLLYLFINFQNLRNY